MVRLYLALAVIIFSINCAVAHPIFTRPLTRTLPRHWHGRFTIEVFHGRHAAFFTDHVFTLDHFPFDCAISATGDESWKIAAQTDYLRCPLCNEYVTHDQLRWEHRYADLAQPLGVVNQTVLQPTAASH